MEVAFNPAGPSLGYLGLRLQIGSGDIDRAPDLKGRQQVFIIERAYSPGRVAAAPFSGDVIPGIGLAVILFDMMAVFIHQAEVILGIDLARAGGLLEPLCRLPEIALDAEPQIIVYAHIILRGRIARFGQRQPQSVGRRLISRGKQGLRRRRLEAGPQNEQRDYETVFHHVLPMPDQYPPANHQYAQSRPTT